MSLTETKPGGAAEPPEPPPEGFERKKSRVPIVLLGVIALGALLALGFTMFGKSVAYYYTPTEVLAQEGEEVRLSGTVVDGSITTDAAAGTVSFEVTDGTTVVPVVFTGPPPDTLQDGGEAVAEGVLDAQGAFRADTLFAKCPSKFETKEP